ncbi:biliverdin-producing heme oxygenase [Parvularcula maris]|uniref:Biliverdin-producing heme oxygenase n=1 Tax=Parvularcula maris TaxID=2965077 RepID=A0A9X2LAD5_9PROT|nr:biliverdin-producing heme oxygenase [Parvularcula maris]MCQ8185908.1 biliverdin-producing heme oxygenase [Parvularcula maris]
MADRAPSLRFLLKQQTAETHQKTDDALSLLELGTPQGLAGFLRTHARALGVIEPFLQADGRYPAPPRLGLLREDLAALGASMPGASLAALPPDTHPLGVAYVIAGSALGTEVLRRRWLDEGTEETRVAYRFLSDDRMKGYWGRVLTALGEAQPSEDEVEKIVEGAEAAFGIYQQAIEEAVG